jgi:glutamate synthase (NADPH/NADH) small chain
VGLKVAETEYRDGGRFPKPGTEHVIPADLVLLSLGFTGPEYDELDAQLKVGLDERGNILREDDFSTSVPGVYVAGDAGRGASLIVWAIAEGRAAAHEVDKFLQGETDLPSPVRASDRPISV